MKNRSKLLISVLCVIMTVSFVSCRGGGNRQPTEEATVSDSSATHHQETGEHTHSAGASGDIGIEEVKAMVLAKVPGATGANFREIEREHDDGRLEYEGSLYYNGYEYEFEVDGATGNILKWEIDD